MPPLTRKRRTLKWLLLLPYLFLCFPILYARNAPELYGFPFFYWWQFLWVILSSLIMALVYHRIKQADKP